MMTLKQRRAILLEYRRLDRVASKAFTAQEKLQDKMIQACPYKHGDILEFKHHTGTRKHWGYVSRVHGDISWGNAGWRIWLLRCNKNGTLTGGRFYISDQTVQPYEKIGGHDGV